jgi:nucleotide-binding universal stress UspA family protein
MFCRILVPLDGSHLAETVLPVAHALAGCRNGDLLLFHVIEKGASASVHGDRHLQDPQDAQAYLDSLAQQYSHGAVKVENHVHTQAATEVPTSIVEHAEELHCDLIVLCAHGRGGLRDRFIGSIARQVIQRGVIPVLFIRPDMNFGQFQTPPKRLMVPLDGEGKHEDALPITVVMAADCDASIELISVVPTTSTLPMEQAGTGRLMPMATAAMLDLSELAAVDYLQKIARGLIDQGLRVRGKVLRGDVAGEVVRASENADMVIMATHALTNWEAFWQQSVTPKVMAKSSAPVLLVRKA